MARAPSDEAARTRAVFDGMVRAVEAHDLYRARKHVIIAVAVFLVTWLEQAAWLLAVAPLNAAIDYHFVKRMRRLARAEAVGPGDVRIALAHHGLTQAALAAFACWIASDGSYQMQLAALLILAGMGIHAVTVDAHSARMIAVDVAVVAVSMQIVVYVGSDWTTTVERAFLHIGLGAVAVFLAQCAQQAALINRRLRDVSSRLRRAQRSDIVGQMAGGIAHDFNNLLTVMRGNLDLLREVPEAERPALMAQIEEAAVRGSELVARLNQAGRADGAAASQPQPLNAALDRFERMARRTLPANVRLTIERRDAGEQPVRDPMQLELALLNLTMNARDAVAGRGGRILVRAKDLGGDGLRLTVEDDGIGMTPEVLARATDAYETTKPVGKGTGLGLSMVADFVAEMDGSLGIDSAPGAGTRVEIVLPPAYGTGAVPLRPATNPVGAARPRASAASR